MVRYSILLLYENLHNSWNPPDSGVLAHHPKTGPPCTCHLDNPLDDFDFFLCLYGMCPSSLLGDAVSPDARLPSLSIHPLEASQARKASQFFKHSAGCWRDKQFVKRIKTGEACRMKVMKMPRSWVTLKRRDTTFDVHFFGRLQLLSNTWPRDTSFVTLNHEPYDIQLNSKLASIFTQRNYLKLQRLSRWWNFLVKIKLACRLPMLVSIEL